MTSEKFMKTDRLKFEDRIIQDPHVMVGKPVIKGTRIPVETVIALLANDPNLDELFLVYPELTIDDVKASLEFAHAAVAKATTDTNGKSLEVRPAHV
jgi:uncharacterized protein (DUF433 family)